MKRYRIKVNGLYVTIVSVFSQTIDLGIREYGEPRYFTEAEKDFVLKYFPEAEVKHYSLVKDDGF